MSYPPRPNQHFSELVGTPAAAAQPLITPGEVRRRLTVQNPEYGRTFTEDEWRAIAARLSSLARLIGRITRREFEKERQQRADPASPTKRRE